MCTAPPGSAWTQQWRCNLCNLARTTTRPRSTFAHVRCHSRLSQLGGDRAARPASRPARQHDVDRMRNADLDRLRKICSSWIVCPSGQHPHVPEWTVASPLYNTRWLRSMKGSTCMQYVILVLWSHRRNLKLLQRLANLPRRGGGRGDARLGRPLGFGGL